MHDSMSISAATADNEKGAKIAPMFAGWKTSWAAYSGPMVPDTLRPALRQQNCSLEAVKESIGRADGSIEGQARDFTSWNSVPNV